MNAALGFLVLFLLGCSQAFGQNSFFEPVFEVDRKHQFIWTDNLQNLYLINESEIEMYASNGEPKFKNSQLNLGQITGVDFNYSLKPLVFFGNTNTALILDNTLSVQGNPINLSDYGLNWVTAAAKSVDNHYWFFDTQTLELVRTDNRFKKVRSAGNISQLLGFDVQPNFIEEHNSWVYVNNPETGILVFDIFGTYFKQIPIVGLTNFQVTDQYLVYFKNNKIHHYNLKTFTTTETILPIPNAQNARVVKDMLFISTESGVRVYRKR